MYVCMYVPVYVFMCMYARKYDCMYSRYLHMLCKCECLHMHSMYVCMYVCMYMCTHHRVVFSVPVYSGLSHEHRDVLLQLVVVQLQRLFDEIVLASKTSILYVYMYVCIDVIV